MSSNISISVQITEGDNWNDNAAEYARQMENGPLIIPIKTMLSKLDTLFDEEDVERVVEKFADLVRERCKVPRQLVGVAVVVTGRK